MENLAPLVSVFTVSLLHTLIPSHWLCFVVVGKAQGWRTRQMLIAAGTAGLLHVLSTVTLGVLILTAGRAAVESELVERLSAFILMGLGVVYLALHVAHAGHHHEQDRKITGRVAFAALLFSLTLSPCSAAITLLVVASKTVTGVMLVSGVLLATTLGTMLLLVGLTSLGIEKLKFMAFDRYEKLIVGFVLTALGAVLLLLHNHAE